MIKLSRLKQNLTIGVAVLALAVALPFFINSSSVSAEETADTPETTKTEEGGGTTNRSEYEKRMTGRAEEIQKQAAERAEEIQKQAAERAKELETKATERARELENRSSDNENGETVRERLTEAKLKVCQNREKNIKNIAARLDDRGTKQLDVFTKIAERTQTFYEEKGNVLSNYDALVSDVNTKEAAARAAVVEVKAAGSTFACDGTDPKGSIEGFKSSLNARNEALKAYKTAVKNLIVGVKSAQTDITTTEGGE